ncbi:MAG: AAA family ATPase, partial [Treponema sp.]|nr:AAA family ATPase [Treponema sp.]
VLRIKECYKDCVIKPEFQISDNSISVLLPLSRMDLSLSDDERTVYETLSRNISKAISEIVASVPFGKSKVGEILHSLVSFGFVRIMGNGRGTKYCL